MKAILLSALLTINASLLFADAVMLKKGTPVKLKILETISSETAKIGDLVNFEVAEDVKVDDSIVIPVGNKARGFVARAESRKLFGAGALNVYVHSVVGPGGLLVPLYGLSEATTAGADTQIAQGSELTAHVDVDVPVEVSLADNHVTACHLYSEPVA